ncbi:MAG: hypothetical protein E7452_09810 [Ruminococcaceae bacterium]|nr:hypothetical protein [Oscillospiraceae bacterium]
MKNRGWKQRFVWILVLVPMLLTFGCGTKDAEQTTEATGETGRAMTELGTEPAIGYVQIGDDQITVNGQLYTAAAPWGARTNTVVGIVSAADEVDRLGVAAYATDIPGYVRVDNGDQSWTYRYVGAVGGGTMADWIAAYGVTTETVTRVDLQDKARDSEVNDGQIVTFTPHRATVTDAAKIATLLDAMSMLPRDAAGYEAALAATEKPYEGHIRVTLLQSNPDGSVREWGSFVWYPKLGYVNDGYKTDAAFGELLKSLLG